MSSDSQPHMQLYCLHETVSALRFRVVEKIVVFATNLQRLHARCFFRRALVSVSVAKLCIVGEPNCKHLSFFIIFRILIASLTVPTRLPDTCTRTEAVVQSRRDTRRRMVEQRQEEQQRNLGIMWQSVANFCQKLSTIRQHVPRSRLYYHQFCNYMCILQIFQIRF